MPVASKPSLRGEERSDGRAELLTYKDTSMTFSVVGLSQNPGTSRKSLI